jgi:DNA-binding beta-propeller fold protein YncE
VALSPDDKFLYVAAYGSDAVAVFSRNLSTGVLTQLSGLDGCVSKTGTSNTCAVGAALGGATGLAMSPDGNYLYVASYDDNAVVRFSRNSTSGVLSYIGCIGNTNVGGACTVGRALGGAVELVVSPNGGNLYVAAAVAHGIVVFTRNTSTGAITQPSDSTGCFNNNGSGTCTSMGSSTLSGSYDIVVSPDSANVYVASPTSNAVNVFSRNLTTGLLTRLSCVSETGTSGACADGVALTGSQSVAVSPDGQDVYSGSFTDDAVAVFKRDSSTGALTQWTGTRACHANTSLSNNCTVGRGLNGRHKLAISPDGKDVYSGGSDSTATGFVTVLGRRR